MRENRFAQFRAIERLIGIRFDRFTRAHKRAITPILLLSLAINLIWTRKPG